MKIVWTLLLSLVFGKLNAQVGDSATGNLQSKFVLERSIPGQFSYMNADVLGNLFVITQGNRLFKLNDKGDSAGVFNDVRKYGNPTDLDISNPLKVIVYYRNFSTAVILDRFLTLRNTLDFRKLQIFKAGTVANAYDNQYWLFDEQDFKLKKISEDGRLLQESADLRLVLDMVPSPKKIIDSDNLVFLYDPEQGFYVFDYYGAWKNRLPFTGWKHVGLAGKTLYGFTDNQMHSYELGTLQLKTYTLPDKAKGYQHIRLGNGRMYILQPHGVDVYQIY